MTRVRGGWLLGGLFVGALALAAQAAGPDPEQVIRYYRKKANVAPAQKVTVANLRDSAIKGAKVDSLPVVAQGVRIAEPVAKVGKFLCIGLNYADHAKESNMPEPAEPIIFMKATSAIIGPNDDVYLPPNAKKGDWEVELGIVIGKEARYEDRHRAHYEPTQPGQAGSRTGSQTPVWEPPRRRRYQTGVW